MLDKNDVLTGLFASWDAIGRLLDGLPDDDWDAPTSLPGWQVRDVLAHIAGTEAMLLGMSPAEPDVDVSALDHVHNPIGALNEKWVRHLRAESAPAVLERYELTDRRRSMLTKMIPRGVERADPDPGRAGHLRAVHAHPRLRLLDARAGHPGRAEPAVHRRRISAATTPGGPRRDRRQHGVRDRQEGWRARRRPHPDRTERTGGAAASGCRCRAAPRWSRISGAPATTTISLDGLQFTRLCGGRPMTRAPQAIDYDGDVAVGERIVSNLAYVI